MRKLLIAATAVMPLVALAAEPRTITLDVQNMSCNLCPITVRKALEQVAGVSAVKVDFDRRTATVIYDPDKTKPEELMQATTNAGYPSTTHQ
ncbi:mercury resistance system periplasmic binding protein MerP [Rhizobium mayense]|uniref:Periplasmic mercury ion-binding protein n=1 Tax=Rhizobium mayense TaxID=1312184 RepID=A0ABT7K167_9HYPH|nr:mercury resistance system periplasmic binding protein MerP [Rhizobium mayense]MDL2400894.1 mercury resistance system periplasmic binding protein MerP [Rhizobium mayense]